MPTRQPQLEDWEIAIIRAMLAAGRFSKQEIVAYFSRPERSINQARISEIEDNHERYRNVGTASNEELATFLSDWRQVCFPSAPAVPLGPMHQHTLTTLFGLRNGRPIRLHASETATIEGKESFDWGAKSKYCKTLAGMANNSGGYLLFGVRDGSFEITGVQPDRMERFDLRKANEYLTRAFNQALQLEKGQFEIGGMTIGALYVYPSKNKPVVCTLDGNDLFSGDIYYRYPGETRRIQAPELEQLLKERDSAAEGRLIHLVAKLAETGAQNAAIINLKSGEVDGAKGRFLIDEKLLDKVKFIAQGRFDENNAEPTLRVVGDVQPISGGTVSVQQTVVGSITERHIHEAFLYQRCQYNPQVYIHAQTHLQPLWLPIFFFAKEANLSLTGLTEVLEQSESPYAHRITKQVQRVTSGRSPGGAPSAVNVTREREALISDAPIEVGDVDAARKFLQTIRLIFPDQVQLGRLLTVLTDLRARFGNTQALLGDFRYAISAIDLAYFRPQLIATGQHQE
jgi:hypothetical protein